MRQAVAAELVAVVLKKPLDPHVEAVIGGKTCRLPVRIARESPQGQSGNRQRHGQHSHRYLRTLG
jgi:hypothetical protein